MKSYWLLLLPIAAASGWFAATGRSWLNRKQKKEKYSLPKDYLQGLNYLLNEEHDKALDVFIKENLAYVADWTGGLRIIDIGNPTIPVEIGSFESIHDDEIMEVYVSGNYAYVANLGGLSIVVNFHKSLIFESLLGSQAMTIQ